MSVPLVVLIAEPDPMISGVLRVEFASNNFLVLLAADGKEAEDYAVATLAHLVVLDVGKLHFGGYEACLRIRRLPGYAGRPIVLTAADLSGKGRSAAEKAGATALLPKPYSLNDLFSVIRPHVAADDPLLTARGKEPGMLEFQEWTHMPPPAQRFSAQSALSQNGMLLPIVRRRGVDIPLMPKPQP